MFNRTLRSGAVHQIGSCCETDYMQQQPKFKTGRGVRKGNVSCRRELLDVVPKTLPNSNIRVNYCPNMVEFIRFVNSQYAIFSILNLLLCQTFSRANHVPGGQNGRPAES